MKYRLACLSAILALIYGDVIADDDYDDEDIKKTTVVSNESSEEESGDSIDNRKVRQNNLLEENESGKNYNELEVLEKSGFVVTKKGLADLEKNFNKAVTKVDLFEFSNMKAALLRAFKFAMDKKAETNFIVSENDIKSEIKRIRDKIKENIQQNERLIQLHGLREDNESTEEDEKEITDLSLSLYGKKDVETEVIEKGIEDLNEELEFYKNESKEDLYNLPESINANEELYDKMQNFDIDETPTTKDLENLKNIYSLLSDDKNIGEENVFSKFVKGMINVYQVFIARETAENIMKENRSKTEDRMISTRKSSSVGAGGRANIGAAKLGTSASYHKDEGSDDSSLYTVSVGGGARLSIGVGLANIGAELGVSADVTKAAVFYSLEQLLDSGKIKTGVLSAKSLKKILKSRHEMQARERIIIYF